MPPKKFVGTIRRFAKPPPRLTLHILMAGVISSPRDSRDLVSMRERDVYLSVMHFSAAARNPIGWHPSVCLSVTVVDCDLIYWNFSEVIT